MYLRHLEHLAFRQWPEILQQSHPQNVCVWGEMKRVHGKPRHSQSQGSVERANQDIENMLATWMETNKTSKWSEGLKFVQAMKNRAYHDGIKSSPYEIMFGVPMRMGLATSVLPRDAVKTMNSEEDLETVLSNITTVEMRMN
uniref:KRAB-A domain-containing protein 2 n=1 Tax=Cacopsylla melanoneura TaxID=428564 RepID=A0A8D9F0Q7_9HEMI